MNKALLFLRFSHKFFLVVFAASTLPFILIKLYGSLQLKELPFLFIAVLGLIKFYLAKAQDTAVLQNVVKQKLGPSASKQEIVNKTGFYRASQDAVLLINLVLILILNIFL